MNILLICPPISLDGKKIHPRDLPLLLPYVAAFLKKFGFNVEILDCFQLNLTLEGIIKEVEKRKPNIIGIAPYDYSREIPIEISLEIGKLIKSKFSNIPTGLLWSYNFDHFVSLLRENLHIDYVVLGDPELPMAEFCKAIKNNSSPSKVRGLAYREKITGEIIVNKNIEFIRNLDTLPFPMRDLLQIKNYRFIPHKYRSPSFVTVLASRGCPFNCRFCFRDFYPRVYRTRSVENVIGEIKYILKKYKTDEIHFEDPFLKRDWLMEFCDGLIREGIKIKWSCLMRVDNVDKELFFKMAEAGCVYILFGLESGCQELLNIVDKKTMLLQAKRAIKFSKEVGIETIASFLLGLPGEDINLGRKTVKFALCVDPDYAQFFITKIYNADTSLKDYGSTTEWDYSNFDFRGPIFLPYEYKNIDTLKKLQKYAYFKFYLRLPFIIRKIAKIRNISDLKRYFIGFKILFKIG